MAINSVDSEAESVLPVMMAGKWPLPALVSTHEPFILFSLPRKNGRTPVVQSWHPAQLKSPQPTGMG